MAQETAVMQLIKFILVERRQEDGSIKFHAHEDFGRFLQMEKEQMKSIELPSDEEIESGMNQRLFLSDKNIHFNTGAKAGFKLGANWMKEQIFNQEILKKEI